MISRIRAKYRFFPSGVLMTAAATMPPKPGNAGPFGSQNIWSMPDGMNVILSFTGS